MKVNYQALLAKRDVNPVLKKWRGHLVKFWGCTVSHGILEIRVIDQQNSSNYLTIWCGDVENLQGPIVWFNCDLKVEVIPGGLALRDMEAKFEVRAGAIGVEETSGL